MKDETKMLSEIRKVFCNLGKSITDFSDQMDYIKKSDWYNNRPPEILKPGNYIHDHPITWEAIEFVNPKNHDWKTLDVNCLPEDILVNENYEYMIDTVNCYGAGEIGAYIVNEVLFDLVKGKTILYRLKKTKKTHEDYANEHFLKYGIHDIRKLKLAGLEEFLKAVFISGRKSMESSQ